MFVPKLQNTKPKRNYKKPHSQGMPSEFYF